MSKIFSTKSAVSLTITLGALLAGMFVLRSKGMPTKGFPRRETRPGEEAALQLQSAAFIEGQMIPKKYTCDGENISPPLEISHVSAEAQSLVLVVHDPDAPVSGGWTHWILVNINPLTTMIAENSVPPGALEATTSFGVAEYGGPCPPSGIHHYEFKLYALDTRLALDEKATKIDIEHAMEGHILDQTVLTGLYQRLN